MPGHGPPRRWFATSGGRVLLAAPLAGGMAAYDAHLATAGSLRLLSRDGYAFALGTPAGGNPLSCAGGGGGCGTSAGVPALLVLILTPALRRRRRR